VSPAGPIASLPMYDRAEIAGSTNALWEAIRDALRQDGIEAPEKLTRAGSLWDHWRHPGLVLSQTCGLPYRKALHDSVTLIGTPDYALPGCPPGHYNSVILMRPDDARTDSADWPGLTLALNDAISQSGWAAALETARAHGTRFGDHLETGAHRASVRAVAEGRADICFVDAQTWRLMSLWDSLAPKVTEIGRTAPSPGLPLISARGAEAERIASAVRRAIERMPAADRRTIGITGLTWIPPEAYLEKDIPEPPPASSLPPA